MRAGITPLPWAILRLRGNPPKIIQPGKAGVIAVLGLPGEGDREANGQLFLAAPQMLEALKWAGEMMGYAAYQLKPEWRSANGADFDDALAKVREAIASTEVP